MRILRIVVALLVLAFSSSAMAQVKLTFWSHWAAEKIKRDFMEDAIKRFEAANPGVKIEASWYEKTALYAALKTALRAGTAPDIFYAEPDQVEYMENNLLLDLTPLNWSGIEPWAKEIWTYKGKPYGLPLEAWTVQLYYNKKTLADLGVGVPANLQLSAGDFTDMVKKARAKGITPMSLGVGDRPFPGAFVTHEALLEKLGIDAYTDLLNGKLLWSDPRVVDTLRVVRSWVDAGLLPTTFTTMKLGESHTYFYSNPGAATLLMGAFYPSRAFNPPDKGGQPPNFPLGIMNFPAIPGAVCNECRTLAVGGSYVANASTKYPQQAIAFLNSIVTPTMANRWLEEVVVQTGLKADLTKIAGPNAAYLKELFAANAQAKYFFGLPSQRMQAKPKEVFTQVFNNAFPAGTISVEDAVKQMNAAYGK
ncbi:MAG: extracellular solute-binding protein [Pseudomonadota bacterium]|nr:extracellular solute-binding protein [Pseudomonadota bacterium]